VEDSSAVNPWRLRCWFCQLPLNYTMAPGSLLLWWTYVLVAGEGTRVHLCAHHHADAAGDCSSLSTYGESVLCRTRMQPKEGWKTRLAPGPAASVICIHRNRKQRSCNSTRSSPTVLQPFFFHHFFCSLVYPVINSSSSLVSSSPSPQYV